MSCVARGITGICIPGANWSDVTLNQNKMIAFVIYILRKFARASIEKKQSVV